MVFFIILIIIIAWAWIGYNSLVRAKNYVEGSWAQIDVELKRRADLIPNLVEVVKGYAQHEREVLEKVTEARNMAASARTQQERIEAENKISGFLGRLIAVAEAYPDLKANENFLSLQKQLQETEDKIEKSRREYNSRVMSYHAAIRQVPRNILAAIFNFTPFPYFTATDEDRENVKVKFD